MSRIIAGSAKGRRIDTPKGSRTRPTTDRTREALFSALASWFGTADEAPERQLDGVAVLDLFAGSGAVGLEAASRGAGPVVLVESDGSTARLIAANARDLRLRADVRAARAHKGGVILCVGAAVDFLSGSLPRAPQSWQRFGLEWLHRLLSEPRRLWRRYLVDGPKVFLIYLRRVRAGDA